MKFVTMMFLGLMVGCGGIDIHQSDPEKPDIYWEKGSGTGSTTSEKSKEPKSQEKNKVDDNSGGGGGVTADVDGPHIVLMQLGGVSETAITGCETSRVIEKIDPLVLRGDLDDLFAASFVVKAYLKLRAEFDERLADKCKTFLVKLERTSVAKVPSRLHVVGGNAGNRQVFLQVGEIRCEYRGGAAVADPFHPYRANQVGLGMQLNLAGCLPNAVGQNSDVWAKMFSLYFPSQISGIPMSVDVEIELEYPIYSIEEIGKQ